MKIYLTPLILFSSILPFLSCSTGPDFERENENDPIGENFVPDPPSGLNYQMDDAGNISLFWEDKTDFELGYRIYKSLGENEKFTLLTELKENSTTYTDTSKLFAFPTQYHIVSFSNEKQSDTLTIDIEFGGISDFEAEFSVNYDRVNFSWQSEFFFIEVDGFLLLKKTDKNSVFKFHKVLPNSVDEYSIPTPQDGFVHEFKLSAFNLYGSDTTSLESNTVPRLSTEPKKLELRLITPDSLMATWKSISNFEDSFQLTINDETGQETVIVDENHTTHTFARQFIIDNKVEVRLAGRNNSALSPIVTKTLKTILNPPILEQVQHISSNELAISISDTSQVRREINIFRKTKNSDFQEIGTVEKGNSSFLDNTVDPTKNYTYYATTALAMNSDPLKLHYGNSFEHLAQISGLSNFAIQEKSVAHRQGSSKIVFLSNTDPLEATVYDVVTETILLKFELAALPNKIIFNDNETKIYTTNLENSTIHVYDFKTGLLIDSLIFHYSRINEISLLNNEILVATAHTVYTDLELISIDLASNDYKVIDTFGLYYPYLIFDNSSNNLLVIYEAGSGSINDFYSITEGRELIFNDRKEHSFFTTNFSADLDTAVVVEPDNISLYDMNSGESLWHFKHHSISNYCCSNVQLLPEQQIVLQGQSCSRLLDTKLVQKPITDVHCDNSSAAQQGLLSAAGLVFMANIEDNYILDFRRSHTSGKPSFIDKLTINKGWKKIYEE